MHHLLSGSYRIGHDETIPLCPWHHVGEPVGDRTVSMMELALGPSFFWNKKAFIAEFGTEAELLQAANDWLDANPQEITGH